MKAAQEFLEQLRRRDDEEEEDGDDSNRSCTRSKIQYVDYLSNRLGDTVVLTLPVNISRAPYVLINVTDVEVVVSVLKSSKNIVDTVMYVM